MADDSSDGERDGSRRRKRDSQAQPGNDDNLEYEPESKRIKTAHTVAADQLEYVVLDDEDIAEFASPIPAVEREEVKEVASSVTLEEFLALLVHINASATNIIGPRVQNYRFDVTNFDTLRRRIIGYQHRTTSMLYTLIFEDRMNHYHALRMDLNNRIEQFRAGVEQIKYMLTQVGRRSSRPILPVEVESEARDLIEDSDSQIAGWRGQLHQPFKYTGHLDFAAHHASVERIQKGARQVMNSVHEAAYALQSFSRERFRADIATSVFVIEERVMQLMLKIHSLRVEIEKAGTGFSNAYEYMEADAPAELPAHVYQRDGHAILQAIEYYSTLFDDCHRTIEELPVVIHFNTAEYRELAKFILDEATSDLDQDMSEDEVLAVKPVQDLSIVSADVTNSKWMHSMEQAVPFFNGVEEHVTSLQRTVRKAMSEFTAHLNVDVLPAQFNTYHDMYRALKLMFVTLRDGLPRLPNDPVNHYITSRKLAGVEWHLKDVYKMLVHSRQLLTHSDNPGDSNETSYGNPIGETLEPPYVGTFYDLFSNDNQDDHYIRDEAMSGDDDDGEDSASDREYEDALYEPDAYH